ncbi:ABC transporter related protein OS=Tsukamurella paurometabola (strain ATCC 8368 / DSM / CCUG 35730 / CIP 100753 / JCM 10117 / KCTC 9821 / NBRC 16120 / NCIMB 702349 / NCTC 13040) OX=521096 GN=Tpau_0639 PE=4 SV=1 [Tsukamurella paurometabola]|uniref:ABC transporter related protein n=1 Tax=Tsukamurella paurometabola (strain ATCC 8368 / DSM 20162 / CCUG 35730 / CIP 100753 / JCM 10117 / KCTC 9821 / NBRC 16120 / NCIMB 702349 / NCTC 13040) TaxID=521096 RepID=D5USY9_TSUPD|nr:ABC transporter related protein [Tsukamurella paurometabola DSM 20162]SUP43360.1 Lipoprotein-releasing system ATP-binding protein LolD [Tsukamurella paurometabola]
MSTTIDDPHVLSIDHVDLVRNGRKLLDDVSLHVRRGEHWVLLGANGAGKSTLLGLCGAVTHPTRGTVDVLGKRLGRVDMRELRTHIGHVNPRHRLDAPLRVRDVVITGLTNTPEFPPRWAPTAAQRERAEALIDSLGMTRHADSVWPTLSQGERGRALIARALMGEPDLLLLDEPATGLDLAARERLLTSVDGTRRAHPDLASILVTHHLEEIPTTTTHAVLIRDGAITATGPVAEVLTTERISAAFDHPITIDRQHGRWTAVSR